MKYILAIVFAFVAFDTAQGMDHIKDHKIYKIASKADNGVLTLSSNASSGNVNDLAIRVQPWADAGGQKWRSKLPLLAKSFVFKPTSFEHANLDADVISSNVTVQMGSSSDTKYWYIRYVGEGVFEMKNYKTESCITNQGTNKTVKLTTCDNSSNQEWIFTEL